ncbi:MAG: pitrilysin family protein [Myxococcota bacterium]
MLLLLAVAACRKPDATQAPEEREVSQGKNDGVVMVWPDEGFRYEAPKPGPTPEVTVPAPTVFELDGGITVYLVQRMTIPTVSLSLVFPTGSIIDPKGKRGLASACMDLLEQGTASLDKPAFEARKADLASGTSAWANAETSGVAMSSLHRNFADTADLMLEMLERPGLRARDLERLRSRRKANLAQNKAAPSSLGRRLWRSVLWGPEHPYGVLTTKAQYDALSVDDCRGWLAKLGTAGAQMYVAGSTDEAEIRSLFEERLSAWGKDSRGRPRTTVTLQPPVAAPRRGTIFFADVPGAAQSQIYIGHAGPGRKSEDYEATMIMAQILGGSFSSRINMNIREDKGYAYGARARFSYRRAAGSFAASSSVRSDATGASITEMVKEIRKIRSEGVTNEEIERERQGTLLGLPARFSTAGRVRNTYSSLVFFGLPLDYYDGFQKRVAALDASRLLAAAKTHLRDRGYTVLVVGDGETVRDSLKALAEAGGLGEEGFVELDGDGTVVSGGV